MISNRITRGNKMIKKFRQQGNHGFTLLELVITICILGVIMGVAVPTFTAQKQRAIAAQNGSTTTTSSGSNTDSNTDPKNGPVRVDDIQYKVCEGTDLNFKSFDGDNLLSVSHDDPACL